MAHPSTLFLQTAHRYSVYSVDGALNCTKLPEQSRARHALAFTATPNHRLIALSAPHDCGPSNTVYDAAYICPVSHQVRSQPLPTQTPLTNAVFQASRCNNII